MSTACRADGSASVRRHQALMDRMYRYQRFVYDGTRKYYLLGRDRLIREMDLTPGARVLEVGCGTARNLVALARRAPDADLYGLDLCREMLRTAERKLARRGLAGRVTLRCAGAEAFHYRTTFGLERPFDAVFFSYALSMIPPWREALSTAVANVRPGGDLYIVDFWDQGGLPTWFRALLTRWLAAFHVRHEPALLAALDALGAAGVGKLRLTPVARRYAYVAHLSDVNPARLADADLLGGGTAA
ncbi:MAG: class I SAM-dependent methyltransferase [Planctomycetota bacterium]